MFKCIYYTRITGRYVPFLLVRYTYIVVYKHGVGRRCKILNKVPFYLFPSFSFFLLPFNTPSSPLGDGWKQGYMDGLTDLQTDIQTDGNWFNIRFIETKKSGQTYNILFYYCIRYVLTSLFVGVLFEWHMHSVYLTLFRSRKNYTKQNRKKIK